MYIFISVFPVIERFCLPPGANFIYQDATGAEVDAEILLDKACSWQFSLMMDEIASRYIQVFCIIFSSPIIVFNYSPNCLLLLIFVTRVQRKFFHSDHG